MPTDYETSDPLQLLMVEWSQVGRWFWVFLAAGAVAMFALPSYPGLPVLLAAAGLGNALLRLGATVIITANEVRKELHGAARGSATEDQELRR